MTDPVTPTDTSPRPGRNRWRIAFLVLLGLNLAFAGFVAGGLMRDGGPRGHMVRELGFGPFSEALSSDDRRALRQQFFDRMPDFRETRRAMRAEMTEVIGVLRAVPFDPAAFRAAMDRMRKNMSERADIGRALIAERIAAMNDAERAVFADRLEKSLSRGGKPPSAP